MNSCFTLTLLGIFLLALPVAISIPIGSSSQDISLEESDCELQFTNQEPEASDFNDNLIAPPISPLAQPADCAAACTANPACVSFIWFSPDLCFLFGTEFDSSELFPTTGGEQSVGAVCRD